MFGYIKPDVAELKVKEYQLYQSIYCGICHSQKKNTGLFSPFTLSYDYVFLYLLRAEFEKVPTEFRKKRFSIDCNRNKQVAVQNKIFTYCAAYAALLSYLKLKDDLEDGGFFLRLRTLLLLPYAKHSLKKARKKADFPEKEATEAFMRLRALEKKGNCPAEELAECSGTMLSVAAGFAMEDALLSMAAEKIGLYVGKWIYLADAADDLQKDLKNNSFNPFAKDGIRKGDLKNALDNECNLADRMLSMVPVYDDGYRAILRNILFLGMNKEAEKILTGSQSEQTKERQQNK